MALNKRLIEIEERKAELAKDLMNADGERMKEIAKETDELLNEGAEIRKKMDIEGKLTEKESKPIERGSDVREIRGRDLKEKRAVTIGSGTLIKPVSNQTSINSMIGNNISSIVDMVKITSCYNMSEYVVPYVKKEITADKTMETIAAASVVPSFDYASIKPITITTYALVTREAEKLTNADYYNAILEQATKALKRKVAQYILQSDSTSNPIFTGILTAPAIDSSTDIETNSIDDKTLRKIAMSYGGDEDIAGNAVLFLNKKDLIAFGDVRGTNEKRAVYEITPDTMNPNIGVIRDGGLSVQYCLNSNLKDLATAAAGEYSMVYGTPSCYEIGLFSDYTIRTSEDYKFAERMIAILGEVMIGGNVVVKDGFIRVKKTAEK